MKHSKLYTDHVQGTTMKHYIVVITIYSGEYEKSTRSLVAATNEVEAEKLAIEGEVHCSEDEIEYDGKRFYEDGEFMYEVYSIREVPANMLEGVKFAMAYS